MLQRIAVVGLGSISNRHRKNLRCMYPNAEIIAISASGRAMREFEIENCDIFVASIDELVLLNPQFVIVASPSTFHFANSTKLIQAGVPVLIEKPLTASYDDAEQLFKVCKKENARVAVAYCLRFLPSALYVKEIIKSKQLGGVYNVTIEAGQYLPDWRPDKDYRSTVSANKNLGGGALLELSHEIDYARWIFGELFLKSAILRRSEKLGLDVEDLANMVFTTNSGEVVQINLDFLQKKPVRTCTILGERGRLEWDLLRNSVTLTDGEKKQILYSEPSWDKNQMYIDMIKAFIEDDSSCIATLDDGMNVVNLVDQAKILQQQTR